MGRFERKMRKSAKEEMKPFDEWYFEHEEELSGFPKPKERLKSRRVRWKPIAAVCASLLVVAVAAGFTLPLFFTDNTVDEIYYADSEIYNGTLSSSEARQYLSLMGFDIEMEYTSFGAVYTVEENSIAFVTLYGEVETPDDYYLITFYYHLDSQYHFIAKAGYESLTNQTTINGYDIWYQYDGTVSDDLATYDLKIQYGDHICYIEMQCFENCFDEFLQLLCG